MVSTAIAEWIRMAPVATLEAKLRELEELEVRAKPRDTDHIVALRSAIQAELRRLV